MKLTEAASLAEDIMRECELMGYVVRFDGAKRRFGQTRYDTRIISLSGPLVRANDRPAVEDTIRHEVAHALLGPGYGHGPVWKHKAREVGASDARCYGAEVIRPEAPWTFTCPSGCVGTRYRKPDKPMACGKHRQRIEWRRT